MLPPHNMSRTPQILTRHPPAELHVNLPTLRHAQNGKQNGFFRQYTDITDVFEDYINLLALLNSLGYLPLHTNSA